MTPLPMEFPSPPTSPDLQGMHRWILSVCNFMKQTMLNGNQSPHFTQDQLNQMSDLSQAGKQFFNFTTGKMNIAEVSGGTTLVIKETATV
jgi:hypothetical protein